MLGPAPRLAYDTHAHVFKADLPFVAGRRYTPTYDATTDAYLSHLDTAGLSGGVLVQPSFLGIDNSFLIDAIDQHPGRFRGVAVLGADTTETAVDDLDRRGIIGLRYNLLGLDPGLPMRPEWQTLNRLVIARNWHIEIHLLAVDIPPLLDHLLDLGATVVIDHFGLPSPELGTSDPGFEHILSRGSDGQIYCKLSAPYRQHGADVRPYAGALIEALGPDRILWGSDWPWTQHETEHEYGDCVTWLHDWTDGDPALIDQINEASRKLFRFPIS